MKAFKITIIGFVIVGIICLAVSIPMGNRNTLEKTERTNEVYTEKQRIYDEADVLTDEEEEKLQAHIEEAEKEICTDIVIVLINEPSMQEKELVDEYANQQLTDYVGWNGPDGDGVVYVDNWAETGGPKWSRMATGGIARERLSDDRTDQIVDDTCEYVNDDPYGSYTLFVDETVRYMKQGRHMSIPWFVAPLIAIVGAAGFIIYQLSINAGVDTTGSETYAKEGSFHMNYETDVFTHSHVTTRKIEKDSGSSSGGGGHGGSSGSH